ncbi:TPA: hypothetical protein DDZ86_03810 [Candidatus Dependentiae bacterium]|nr:MAG: hypothetical protein UW09_C0003G0116 [candidate division TM6 bacterium GW2011_GWF2_43_87]HBL98742.1 hypothetical protein [Candidatus Dependentiae bacterium]
MKLIYGCGAIGLTLLCVLTGMAAKSSTVFFHQGSFWSDSAFKLTETEYCFDSKLDVFNKTSSKTSLGQILDVSVTSANLDECLKNLFFSNEPSCKKPGCVKLVWFDPYPPKFLVVRPRRTVDLLCGAIEKVERQDPVKIAGGASTELSFVSYIPGYEKNGKKPYYQLRRIFMEDDQDDTVIFWDSSASAWKLLESGVESEISGPTGKIEQAEWGYAYTHGTYFIFELVEK